VHKRYQGPSFGPPTPEQLHPLLNDATPTLDDFPEEEWAAVEARRIEATNALLRFARAEAAKGHAKWAEARAQAERARGNDLRAVWEFLMAAGLRILTASDPVAELRQVLGVSRQRGRPPADNAWRDFIITIDVQERVDGGSRVEAACAAIGADANLSPKAVEKIYYTHRSEPDVHDKPAREQLLKYVQSLEQK
jgi:hypothetical protein